MRHIENMGDKNQNLNERSINLVILHSRLSQHSRIIHALCCNFGILLSTDRNILVQESLYSSVTSLAKDATTSQNTTCLQCNLHLTVLLVFF